MRTIKGRYTITGYNTETGLDEVIGQVDDQYEVEAVYRKHASEFQYIQIIDDWARAGDVSLYNYVDGELRVAHVKREPPQEHIEIQLPKERPDPFEERLGQYLSKLG